MAKNEKTQKKTGRIAGTIAELKQVSWPSFPNVMKKLGSVLVITGMFLIVIMGMDALLKWLYSALIMGVVGTWTSGSGGAWFTYKDPISEDPNATQVMGLGEMLAAAIVAGVLVVAAIVVISVIKSRKKEEL